MAEIKNETPVVVPEQETVNKRFDESLVMDGVKLGAGAAAGAAGVYGAVIGIYYAAKWAGKKIKASKEKRAAKKAAKADKGGEA